MRRSWRARKINQGTSLLELTVASGLLMLVLYCGYRLMASGVRFHRQAEALVEAQQNCLAGLAHLTRELAESKDGFVECYPAALVFVSPRDNLGRLGHDYLGHLNWPQVVAYSVRTVEGRATLVRQQLFLELAGPNPPDLRRDYRLERFAEQPSRVVARGAVRFEPELAPGMVRARLVCQALDPAYEVEVETEIHPRN